MAVNIEQAGPRVKDPDGVADYSIDWSPWLVDGDTIASVTWTIEGEGLSKDSDSKDDTTATIWLSGGVAGRLYVLRCKATTTAGRVDPRSFQVLVRDR